MYGVSVMGVEGGSGGIGGKGSDERGRMQSGLAHEPCEALPTPSYITDSVRYIFK